MPINNNIASPANDPLLANFAAQQRMQEQQRNMIAQMHLSIAKDIFAKIISESYLNAHHKMYSKLTDFGMDPESDDAENVSNIEKYIKENPIKIELSQAAELACHAGLVLLDKMGFIDMKTAEQSTQNPPKGGG